jgi:hypothetical protein
MVLKVVKASDEPFGGSRDPMHANYWKREPLIYASGLLHKPPAIRTPRCFGVQYRDDSTAWIWLEDMAHPADSHWTSSRYQLAARRLGEFNGAYLVGRSLPTADALSRAWLRSVVNTYAPAYAQLDLVDNHTLVRQCWPNGVLDRLVRLWQDRELLLSALEHLRATFCHLDAFTRNLLVDRCTQDVVALDWSFAGIAPVGSELAPMVAASVAFYDAEPEQVCGIDRIVFDAYVSGLRAAGWEGDCRVVRLGYVASAALRYGLFPLGVMLLEDPIRQRFERVFRHAASDIVARWAQLAPFLLDQADEARRLLRVL